MKAKKVLAALLTTAMVASMLVGCGAKEEAAAPAAPAEEAAVEPELSLIIASNQTSPENPYHFGLAKFKEVAEEVSGGKIEVITHDGTLGENENELVEKLNMGAAQMVVASPGFMTAIGVPEVDMLSLYYLFDSFEGFGAEAQASEAFQAAHRNTAVDKVLSIMPYPESITVKPGFFPESLDGLEERFCLVSLDVDFYTGTLDGLRYFWPRLEKGGYLLLHDWGSPKLPGVAKALADFETEIGTTVSAVPLCDVGGTLVLCK